MANGLFVNVKMATLNFVRETSITAKLGCVVLSLFYTLSFLFNPLKPLGITPGNLIPPNFWIWTIFTHQFIETNFILLIVSCTILIISSRILEPVWGMIGFLVFFGITTVLSGLLAGAFYLVFYMLTFNIKYLFDVSIYGLAGYLAGFLVAVKQCRGDQMLVGSIGLYSKHLPLLYVGVSALLKLIGVLSGGYLSLVVTGTLVSWVYLRFYQSHNRGRGDGAESFSFKTFFPPPLDRAVGVVSDTTYNILLKLKICHKTSYRYDVGAPSKITITLSGVDALDAERRRNKAIKALDERLQKSQSTDGDSTEWPDLAGEEQKKAPNPRSVDDTVSTSSAASSHSDIVRIDLETSDGNTSH
ncbi:unnamed protein product [Clavelina lepadiformis]|uniref:Transmembrane protein 115 n=1 Tax=Clavelina lepadiformis TaxID=159417 RepID=A0ABP0GAD4_CLALP